MIVRFFAHLREITLVPEVTLVCEDATIMDVLKDLGKLYGEAFEKKLFDDNGKLYMKILINGRNIDYLEGLDSKVAKNDIVAIFPPVAGGCHGEL
jgi:molybdopterin synthase sulfur carrier subunit